MLDFLAAVWGDYTGYGEIRCLKDGKVAQSWLAKPDLLPAANLLAMDDLGWDIYYGVLPRLKPDGTAASCPIETSVLWADVDAKSHPSKMAALYALNSFPVSPSTIIDSGGGYHGYWYLDQPLDLPTAQRIMRRIADLVKGDHVHDAPRILRLPGTHNHKYPPALPVRVLRFDGTYRHHGSDFAAWASVPERRDAPSSVPTEPLPVPVWLRELVESGVPKGSRSEQAFKVAIWMTRYGYDREDIRRVFSEHPFGIGEKYVELGVRGDRWLDRTIDAACEAA
jgi:hypothetical protein